MKPRSDHVILIDTLGQSLRLTKAEWQEALRTAKASGWAPGPTVSPPRDWNLAAPAEASLPWNGEYSESRGQHVPHDDAVS